MPNGHIPDPDEIWHRPDMEKTLQRLADAGWHNFYDGELGCKIVHAVQAEGGILSHEDMVNFSVRLSEPYSISYRNAEVYGTILPHGCISCLQMLQMLECFDPVGTDETLYRHRLSEVAKRAWRDRLIYVADPDF